jgi:hypothetical protein
MAAGSSAGAVAAVSGASGSKMVLFAIAAASSADGVSDSSTRAGAAVDLGPAGAADLAGAGAASAGSSLAMP